MSTRIAQKHGIYMGWGGCRKSLTFDVFQYMLIYVLKSTNINTTMALLIEIDMNEKQNVDVHRQKSTRMDKKLTEIIN